MTVVNRVEPKVLHMPAKGRKLHTHIDPRNGDPTNFLVIAVGHTKDGLGGFVCVVEVEE